MRWLIAVPIAVFLSSSPARAQTAVMSPGSCTGSVTATIGIAAPKHAGETAASVSNTDAPNFFGKAECDCDTQDVYMRLQLSVCLTAGSQGNPTVWVGTSGCTNYDTRTAVNQTQCQRYSPSNISTQSFNGASGNCSTTTFFDVYIPSRALFSPNVGSCDITQASNQVFIFLEGQDPRNPVATCSLPVTQQGTGPTAVASASAASGDGAITVAWQSPPVGSIQPSYYQLLCADADGNPITKSPSDPYYSSCQQDGIHRRQFIFSPSNTGTSTPDAGTTADLGIQSTSSALSAAGPADPAITDDMGTDDLGGADLGGSDLGTTLTSGPRVTQSGLAAPFGTLDPTFICSDRIPVTAQNYSSRISGLVNNKVYRFVVLSIDQFGNATPSAVYEGIPRPVDDLYGRYREAGGTAQGFCFVATAAYGDYDHPQVRVLRAFRDLVLADSAFGRAFIRGYYAASPPLARFIAGGSARRAVARAILWPLVGFALLALRLGSLLLALVVAGGLPTLAIWSWRRRVRRRRLVEVPA